MNKLDAVEFHENPDPRVACALVLDTSSSMSGQPIAALNDALKVLHKELLGDDLARRRAELAIVTFGGTVQTVQEFATVDRFEPPMLMANGGTPMGEAILTAIDLVEGRKQDYKANGVEYYQPWVFVLTDGYPTDEWQAAASRVADLEERRRLAFFAIGVDGADEAMLARLSVRKPKKIQGLKFAELFVWLSRSLSSVAVSKPGDMVALPDRDKWEDDWATA
jgi:uncharacterized protein YegL